MLLMRKLMGLEFQKKFFVSLKYMLTCVYLQIIEYEMQFLKLLHTYLQFNVYAYIEYD